MNFRSDNVTAASPQIMDAIVAANQGKASSYGADPMTKGLEKTFGDLFGCEVAVFPTVTGTAANALCLATLVPAYGAILCHEEAHIYVEEAGGPEFYTGGAKLMPVPGKHGQMDLAALKEMMHTACQRSVHWMPPTVVSVTQSTEAGTVYSLDALRDVIGAAKEKKLRVHMDGSRLGNALARLKCAPTDLTTKLGIDALSFGATKNGAMGAEAVILFKPTAEQRQRAAYLHKRGGHLVSKMRFIAAQLEAYLKNDHWLKNAAHANAMGARLSDGLKKISGADLEHPVEANEVFVRLPDAAIKALQEDGAGFARWGAADTTLVRLVCSFATTEKDVDDFLTAAKKRLAGKGGKAA